MTSYSKAESKDVESIEWSQTRNRRVDETQEKKECAVTRQAKVGWWVA